MENSTIKSILEAAIFAAQDPLSMDKLMMLFPEEGRPEKACIKSVLEELVDDYASRGVELVRVATGYRFQARACYADWLKRLWQQRPPRYSRALFETLSLIAYKQPLTRGEIEEVRGVAVSSHIIKTLMDREWVKVVGHRELPGRPALLATTKQFLDYFNLSSLSGLPALEELMDLDEIGKKLGFETPLSVGDQNTNENTEEEVEEVPQEVVELEGVKSTSNETDIVAGQLDPDVVVANEREDVLTERGDSAEVVSIRPKPSQSELVETEEEFDVLAIEEVA